MINPSELSKETKKEPRTRSETIAALRTQLDVDAQKAELERMKKEREESKREQEESEREQQARRVLADMRKTAFTIKSELEMLQKTIDQAWSQHSTIQHQMRAQKFFGNSRAEQEAKRRLDEDFIQFQIHHPKEVGPGRGFEVCHEKIRMAIFALDAIHRLWLNDFLRPEEYEELEDFSNWIRNGNIREKYEHILKLERRRNPKILSELSGYKQKRKEAEMRFQQKLEEERQSSSQKPDRDREEDETIGSSICLIM